MSAGERLSVVVVEDYGILREELVQFLALNNFDVAGVNCSLGLDDWLASQPRPPPTWWCSTSTCRAKAGSTWRAACGPPTPPWAS